jgi:hypothetical protein
MDIDDFNKLSCAELASITGFDAPRWSRYFNNKMDLTLNTMLISAHKLGMPVDKFVIAFCSRRAKTVQEKGRISISDKDGNILNVT